MLTKSDLASYRQCPRKLWLEKHQPTAADPGDATTWRRARDGTVVGEKARDLLGTNIIWPRSAESPDVAAQGALGQLAAAPSVPGVEIPLFRDGLYARADALVPTGTGYVLQEAKSSTFPLKKDKVTPDKPEDHHLDDVAIQLWVAGASGLNIRNAELNLLNNQWRYPGNGDYRGLFRPWPIGPEIQQRVSEVPTWLAQARQLLAGPLPVATTGPQCNKPYPCPFQAHCETLDPPGPEHPIDLLPGIAGKNLARKLQSERGYSSLLEPAPGELTGKDSALYQRMQRAHRTGNAILEPEAAELLEPMPFPRYYFDFEGIDLPVPYWVGVRPYEQIPFQWSCHIEHADGHFEHREFLDLSGNDPSLACIESMVQAIPPNSNEPIFVYHKTYEEGRLKELAERHPEHAAVLYQYITRLVDLLPIVKDNYYHPAMRGSFSIKKVLPTIARDLDYGALEGVTDGTAAQVAYLYAAFEPTTTPARKEEIRRNLLLYCKRDTWAMVEVAYRLSGRERPRERR